jgi:hypothetical protein
LLLQFPDGRPGISQQLFDVLHEFVPPTLQICPACLHETPCCEHAPYSSVAFVLLHRVGCPDASAGRSQPQQSW